MENKRILIIDDEAPDRKAMTICLERAGYTEIATSSTGQEGIDETKSFKPDIVLIDVVLPDMDGFDVCAKIRTFKEMNLKIIMITGHMDMVNRKKAVASGADEIIQKMPGFTNIPKTISVL